jgi:hypothetical protein
VSTWNLLLTLHAPDPAGVAERRAAAALLGAWLWDDLPADHPAGLIEELDVDGAPVSLLVLDWTTGSQDPTSAVHACLHHLEQQIPRNPATTGSRVTAAAEIADPTPQSPDDSTPPFEMDEQAIATQVLDAAEHFTAIPQRDLVEVFEDVLDPGEGRVLQLQALAGSLILAATWVADQLLDDAAALADGGQVTDTHLLCDLPPQFAPHYTPAFARQFLVAFLDLSARLTSDLWHPPSCVAQDLGVRLLLDQADVVADLAGMHLPEDWQVTIAELLLADIDHEYLYDPALDGFEDDPTFGPPGMASMRVQDWFDHIPGRPPLPPYLT